jgi:hypothetical protein
MSSMRRRVSASTAVTGDEILLSLGSGAVMIGKMAMAQSLSRKL